jgi:hypothetical protein
MSEGGGCGRGGGRAAEEEGGRAEGRREAGEGAGELLRKKEWKYEDAPLEVAAYFLLFNIFLSF